MSEGLARVITYGSIALTAASLIFAFRVARRWCRIRLGFDVARAVIGIGAIVVMATVTGVTTPVLLIGLAIAGGCALGFAQGSQVEVENRERGLYSRRNQVGVLLWGGGIIVMQAAGIGARTGAVQVGQTIAWFSVCLGIGVMVGRSGPMQQARSSLTGVGVAAIILALLLPLALVAGPAAPAAAQALQLTDEEVCVLTPDDREARPGQPGYTAAMELIEGHTASCQSWGDFDYTGQANQFGVYLFPSDEAARSWFEREVALVEASWQLEWEYGLALAERDPNYDPANDWSRGTLESFGVVGGWWTGAVNGDDRVVILAGPFLLAGEADNLGFVMGEMGPDGYREPITLAEELIIPMVQTVDRIETVLAGPSGDDGVPSDEGADAEITEGGDIDDGNTDDMTGLVAPDADTTQEGLGLTPPAASDEEIEPEEAAASSIAGLIAAAAIGLITWTEASSQIQSILDGLDSDGSGGAAAPSEPFIDPYDQQPLEVDPGTGMVFWPWDGGEGHWAEPSAVPGLLDGWNRELETENAARIERHTKQRETAQDFDDRLKRSRAADAARWAGEQARLDQFDRMANAAQQWMEGPDPGGDGIPGAIAPVGLSTSTDVTMAGIYDVDSLDQLDRIREKVAGQGYATDEDLARMRGIANRSRVWVDTKRRWDTEDWQKIERNHAAVTEIAGKVGGMIIDPTRGVLTGLIFGTSEGRLRGDDWPSAIGNGMWEAAILKGTYVIGTWGPGRAALGPIGWGATGGAIAGGGEAAIRGGTWEDIEFGAKTGFVLGGFFGTMERAMGGGPRPSTQVPTIRSRSGGPRVSYDTSRPRLGPPERGGVSMSDPSVPLIRGRTHWDHPMRPGHVDAGDPRYLPPGTAADDVHLPPSDGSQPPRPFDDMDGLRSPTEPTPPAPADVFDPPPPPSRPAGGVPPPPAPDAPPPASPRAPAAPDAPPPIRPRPPPQMDEISAPRPPAEPVPPSPADVFDPPPPPARPAGGTAPPPAPDAPPPPVADVDAPPPTGDVDGTAPTADVDAPPPAVADVDAPPPPAGDVDAPPRPGDVDAPPPAADVDAPGPRTASPLDDARTTRPSAAILDDMMTQPGHPGSTGVPAGGSGPQGVLGGIDTDGSGGVVVGGRRIGNLDPETGGLRNLNNEPMRVAIDGKGRPVGYLEVPDSPPGMTPVYNRRGELAGYVDAQGRADIGGRRVPVAMDHNGNLIPHEAPPPPGPPVEHLPPPGADAGTPPGGAGGPPMDHSPYGQPIYGGDGRPPAALSDIDVGPKVPVLDPDGGVAHYIDPGPREIHYGADGAPYFVQRQHPAQATPMPDIDLATGKSFPGARPMPMPEGWDVTLARHPLTGQGAPPPAPAAPPPTTEGSI